MNITKQSLLTQVCLVLEKWIYIELQWWVLHVLFIFIFFFIDRNVGEKRKCCEYYRTIATQSSVFGAEGGQEETPCSVCKIEHPDSQPEKKQIHKYNKKTSLQIQIYKYTTIHCVFAFAYLWLYSIQSQICKRKYTRTKRDSMQEIILKTGFFPKMGKQIMP